MNWKTSMYMNLWMNQNCPDEHDQTVRTLEDLLADCPRYAALWRRCLAKLESGYDL